MPGRILTKKNAKKPAARGAAGWQKQKSGATGENTEGAAHPPKKMRQAICHAYPKMKKCQKYVMFGTEVQHFFAHNRPMAVLLLQAASFMLPTADQAARPALAGGLFLMRPLKRERWKAAIVCRRGGYQPPAEQRPF